jgi:transcriptional regulator with XRE-family HTH domain
MTFTDQLRAAIRKCGLSRYAISKATGIDQSVLARFMSGQQGIPPASLDALADLLRLKVHAGRPPAKPAVSPAPTRNLDSYRVRCVDNVFASVVTHFPNVGFKQWEAAERDRLAAEHGRPVRLSHYRLDSPLGRRYLPPAIRQEYGLERAEQPNGLTRFAIRLDDGDRRTGWFFGHGSDRRSVLTTEEVALAQKWPTQADAQRVLDILVAEGAVARPVAQIEEVAAESAYSLALGESEWPDAIEVLERDGGRMLLVRDAGEETTQDLDEEVADVLVRLLAKLKGRLAGV